VTDESKKLARRAARGMKKAEQAAPLVFVVPPLAIALEAIQSVVATEVGFMQQEQQQLVRLSATDAKKLQALTSALAQSINTKKELSEEELGNMTDEELETQLVAELERLRAKRVKA
jgi:hypothetical protein